MIAGFFVEMPVSCFDSTDFADLVTRVFLTQEPMIVRYSMLVLTWYHWLILLYRCCFQAVSSPTEEVVWLWNKREPFWQVVWEQRVTWFSAAAGENPTGFTARAISWSLTHLVTFHLPADGF